MKFPKDWFLDHLYDPEEAHDPEAPAQRHTSQTAMTGSDDILEPRSIYVKLERWLTRFSRANRFRYLQRLSATATFLGSPGPQAK